MNPVKYPSFVPDDCQSNFVDDDSYFVNYAEGHEIGLEPSRSVSPPNTPLISALEFDNLSESRHLLNSSDTTTSHDLPRNHTIPAPPGEDYTNATSYNGTIEPSSNLSEMSDINNEMPKQEYISQVSARVSEYHDDVMHYEAGILGPDHHSNLSGTQDLSFSSPQHTVQGDAEGSRDAYFRFVVCTQQTYPHRWTAENTTPIAHFPTSPIHIAEEPASGQISGNAGTMASPKIYTRAAPWSNFGDEQVAFLKMLRRRYRRAGDTDMLAVTHHYSKRYHNATRTKGSLRTKLYKLDQAANVAGQDEGSRRNYQGQRV